MKKIIEKPSEGTRIPPSLTGIANRIGWTRTSRHSDRWSAGLKISSQHRGDLREVSSAPGEWQGRRKCGWRASRDPSSISSTTLLLLLLLLLLLALVIKAQSGAPARQCAHVSPERQPSDVSPAGPTTNFIMQLKPTGSTSLVPNPKMNLTSYLLFFLGGEI